MEFITLGQQWQVVKFGNIFQESCFLIRGSSERILNSALDGGVGGGMAQERKSLASPD